MSAVTTRPGSSLAGLAILALVGLAVFWPVCTFNFTSWDDFETVARNPKLAPPTAASLKSFWTSPQMDLYIPLTYTTWAAVAEVAQLPRPQHGSWLDPHPFHALNLVLHLLASAVVLLILRRLFDSSLAALLGALLFELHPVQVEAVAWVSGTKDLLFALLSLVAIWRYLALACPSAAQAESSAAMDRAASSIQWWMRYLLATAALVLAMLAKPTAMVVPLLVIVIDWLIVGRPIRLVLRRVWPWLILSVPCAIWAWHVQPAQDVRTIAPWARPLIAGDALAFYLYKLVFPAWLGIDYGRMPRRVIEQGFIWWTWIVPAVIAIAVLRRRARIIGAAGLVMVIVLLPVLGLVPFDFQGYSTVADHYLYLAMLGPAMALALVIRRWPRGAVAAGVVLALLGARSFAQTWTWQDSQHLFHHALKVNPLSFASYNSLSAAAIEAGNYPDAIALSRRAIAADPTFAASYLTFANALAGAGQTAAAEQAFRQALALRPDYPPALANLSALLAGSGRLNDAIPLARRAVALQPESISNHLNLGRMYQAIGRPDLARREFEATLRLDRSNATARKLLGELSK